MRRLLILVVAMMILSACEDKGNDGKVHIRLSNISDFDFEHVVVNTSSGEVSYGSLESGDFSDYKSFDLAYSYAFIELSSNGATYTLQPIDYVGETPLEEGDYTYELDLEPQGQYTSLTLKLLVD